MLGACGPVLVLWLGTAPRPATFPTPTGSSSRRTVAACARRAGLWPGWMDVCLALGDPRVPWPREMTTCSPALGPPGELAVVPSPNCPNLPNFRCTSYPQQGIWVLGTLTRTTANAVCLEVPPALGLADSGLPPPPFPSGLWVITVCVHRPPPTPPHRWSEGARAWTCRLKGCRRKLRVSCRAQSSRCLLSSWLTFHAEQTPKRGTHSGRAVCSHSHSQKRWTMVTAAQTEEPAHAPMAAETNYYKLGA